MMEFPRIEKGLPRNIVFESPHQACELPEECQAYPALVTQAARRCDTHIDTVGRLLLEEVGGVLLSSPFSRMVVDLNRGVDRVDARVCPAWPGARVYEDGGVIVPYLKKRGRLIPLYEHSLGGDEVEARLTRYWYPYHETLRQCLNGMMARYGHAILISLHSAVPTCSPEATVARPVVYLGTGNGATCDASLLSLLRGMIESQGAQVVTQDYYQGAFTTQAYGREKEIQAVQIEFDRRFLGEGMVEGVLAGAARNLIHAVAVGLRAISVAGERPPATGRSKRAGSMRSYIDPLSGEIQYY
ncbi:MAG: N-formylglutamate amidohydrolase [bacterium]|jgi:N-formylglutamate amidohydrolase|nr:N-formylglutamate amidohydrolase [bacterium]